MRRDGGLFDWRVTRLLFPMGIAGVVVGILEVLQGSFSSYFWLWIMAGLALLALSTRGPWDSEASGRNRSVLGFRVRPDSGPLPPSR
jgi:uncharacterized membrane protein YfcA